MSEWQPARFVEVHPMPSGYKKPAEGWDHIKRKVFRIREVPATRIELADYVALGCDAERFFEIHPDDNDGFYGTLCEHEILTD